MCSVHHGTAEDQRLDLPGRDLVAHGAHLLRCAQQAGDGVVEPAPGGR
jgi:hypothetical protein